MRVFIETTRDPDVAKLRSLGFTITRSDDTDVAFRPGSKFRREHPEVPVFCKVADIIDYFVK